MLLAIRGVSKSYPGVQALDDVSFTVAPGVVHALLGANGAGKSTLIKILSGSVSRDSGEILFDGMPVPLASPHQAAEIGIACLYQEPALVPGLTVEQNIFLGSEKANSLGVIDTRAQRADAEALIGRVAPRIGASEPVARLRTSERQLVALAKALRGNAKLVIMDEPSASMTDAEITSLFETISRLKANGTSIIYITHRLEEVFRVADFVTVLRDGRQILSAPIGSVSREQLVETIAGGAVDAVERTTRREPGAVLLEVRNLSRAGFFDSVSFEVRAGEIVGLAGLVGAGRSEIARAILCADSFDGGTVTYPRAIRRVRDPAAAVRAGLAMIPEDRKNQAVIPAMSVTENLVLSSLRYLVGPLAVLRKSRVGDVVARNVERFDIRPRGAESRPLSTLSGGNQQKVVLARAIESGADVLILDEPTAGVDVGAKSEIHRHVQEMAMAGKGIVLISSETEEMLALADRILVIREGRLIREIEGHGANALEVMRGLLGEDEEKPMQ
ncbi:MAG: sugar ABC transporter ATP-binding protein [Hyphomicrobiaceae bacterium]|nr:sugar ABC transporter ATP-binding protein [Hyphomicrobiaceae bacterium]